MARRAQKAKSPHGFANSFRQFQRGELMARPAGGGPLTCESCRSIDVREWARRGYLRPHQPFLWSWTRDGEPCGSITVRIEPHPVPGEVVLSFRSHGSAKGRLRSLEQRLRISWTKCHLGGWRPWFRCSCGRRAAKLYDGAADFFACRHCCGLAYASQQLCTRDRLISSARRIRMQLGGGPSFFDPFPDKPRGMHWSTYDRLRARAQASEARSFSFLIGSLRRHCSQWSR
jgi:hypothetical protein